MFLVHAGFLRAAADSGVVFEDGNIGPAWPGLTVPRAQHGAHGFHQKPRMSLSGPGDGRDTEVGAASIHGIVGCGFKSAADTDVVFVGQ